MLQKLKKIDIIVLLIILMPIIDVLNTITGFSLSLVYRGIFLIILLCLFLFKNKCKIKKTLLIFLAILGVFSIIFLFHYYLINNTFNFTKEVTSLVKFLYLPILVICLVSYFYDKKYPLSKIIFLLISIYIISLILPSILGFAVKSYGYGKKGFSGLFYAPNEVGAILAVMSPYAIFYSIKDKHKILNFIITLLFIVSCFLIGTKTPVIGLAVSLITILVVSLIRKCLFHKGSQNLLISISLIIITIIIYNFSYLKFNINYQGDWYENNSSNNLVIEFDENKNLYDAELLNENNHLINFPSVDKETNITVTDNKILNMVFSSRNVFMLQNFQHFQTSSLAKKIFGLSLWGISDKNIGKLSELDFIDILINYGIIGFLVLGLYLIILLVIFFIKFFAKF